MNAQMLQNSTTAFWFHSSGRIVCKSSSIQNYGWVESLQFNTATITKATALFCCRPNHAQQPHQYQCRMTATSTSTALQYSNGH